MDLLTGIASASMDIKSTRLMTDMNVAMLGKTLDTAREQGAGAAADDGDSSTHSGNPASAGCICLAA